MSARILILAVVLLVSRTGHADPDAATKAAGRQMLIALRVLAYDKRLPERSPGSHVTIALVSSASSDGRALRARYEASFGLMPKVKVGGRAVRVVAFDAGTPRAMDAALANAVPSAVIVVDELGDRLAGVRDAARARDVMTMSLREADVSRGLSVGIVPARERDQIVINVEASRAEGVRFGAGLLQLARLVDEGAR